MKIKPMDLKNLTTHRLLELKDLWYKGHWPYFYIGGVYQRYYFINPSEYFTLEQLKGVLAKREHVE
jgi:hypothetical protein